MANPKIQLRHDTSTNWQTQNPVLLEGEVAIETDSNKVKIGNGTDNYNTLPYITDQTKIDLDYSNADYQPVNKAGDTMTGILSIDTDGTNLNLNNPNLTKGTNPSSAKYLSILMNDGSNSSSWQAKRLGKIEYYVDSNGNSQLQIGAIQNVANSQTIAQLQLKMTQAGVASCAFPNTTCCDGQWVNKYLQVETATYTKGTTTKQFSLSSYLPNDGKEYLVLGHWEGNSADALLQVRLTSDIISSNIQICRVPANTSGGSSFVFPIGTGRHLNREAKNGSTSKATGNCYLTLAGYRRCGTNA